MTTPQEPQKPGEPRSGWLVALIAIPVLCCAGPGLLAAIGVGTLGAGVAVGTGAIALGVGLLVAVIAVVTLAARRRRASSYSKETSP